MHDPSTLVGTVRLPIPKRIRRAKGKRWRWSALSGFVTVAGWELYFGYDLVDVWHEEPDGRDAGEVCGNRRLWTHWRHLRFRYPPLIRLRRRLFTVCEWCGELGNRRDLVNVSHGSDHDPAHWWIGERDMYHRACSMVKGAAALCTCTEPVGAVWGDCARCRLFIDGNQQKFLQARRMAKRLGRRGHHLTEAEYAAVSRTFMAAREREPLD